MTYVTCLPLRRGLWVRFARYECWLAYYNMVPGVVRHPGISGLLHVTYFLLGHTKSCSAILDSVVLWVLERRE